MPDTIGNEKRWVTECLNHLQEGHRVFFTNKVVVKHSLRTFDTRHLSENVRKKIKNDAQRVNLMPAGTKAEREKRCARLAIDLSFRCTAEVNQAHQRYPGDFEKLKTCLQATLRPKAAIVSK